MCVTKAHVEQRSVSKTRNLDRLRFDQLAYLAMVGFAFVALLIVLFPGSWLAQKVSTTIIFAQILAFPFPLGLGMMICAAVLSVLVIAKSRCWFAATHCAAWFVVALTLITFPNGLSAGRSLVVEDDIQTTLSVVTFNTGSKLTSAGLLELVSVYKPDIIVLPETSVVDARKLLQEISYDSNVFETPSSGFTSTYNGLIAPTTVLVRKELGVARPIPGPPTSFGTVALAFDKPGLPHVVGVHSAPPLPGLMRSWREVLDRVVAFGESSHQPMVIAGDFNATLRHGALAPVPV